MEIFETKEALKELDQDSMISNLFTQSVNRDQIEMTEEPRSFLNRTILKKKSSPKKMFSNSKITERNFIKENLNLSSAQKSQKTPKEDSKKRPVTAMINPKKFNRFFASRNRPDFLYESSNPGFLSQRNETLKNPWDEVSPSIYSNNL